MHRKSKGKRAGLELTAEGEESEGRCALPPQAAGGCTSAVSREPGRRRRGQVSCPREIQGWGTGSQGEPHQGTTGGAPEHKSTPGENGCPGCDLWVSHCCTHSLKDAAALKRCLASALQCFPSCTAVHMHPNSLGVLRWFLERSPRACAGQKEPGGLFLRLPPCLIPGR